MPDRRLERGGLRSFAWALLGGLAFCASPSALTANPTAPALEAAVVVDVGFKLDVVSQNFSYEYAEWTLFMDGSVYNAIPGVPIAEFNVAQSRREQPKRWGQWRLAGAVLESRWEAAGSAEWKQHKKWFRLTRLSPGDTIDGTYSALDTKSSAGLYESAFASGWKVITFFGDGRFDQGAGGSASTDSDAGSTLAAATRRRAGRYVIDDAGIELRFDDGKRVRATLFFSSTDRRTLFLNGRKLKKETRR